MNDHWQANVKAAERLLNDAQLSMDTASSQREWDRVVVMVAMAHAHAQLAAAKRNQILAVPSDDY